MLLNKGFFGKNTSGLILLFTVFSCAKDAGNSPSTERGYSLSFQLEGIESNAFENHSLQLFGTGQQNNIARGSTPSLKLLEQHELTANEHGFDAVTSVYEVLEEGGVPDRTASIGSSSLKMAGLPRSSNSLLAVKSDMTTGVKYRILLFDAADNFITAIDATVGSVPKFTDALRNTTYKWKAYSYNSSTAITPAIPPNPTAANFNVASSNVGGLLYASGSITTSDVQNDDNKVNILFLRQTAIIEIVFSGRGMFDRIAKLVGAATIPLYSGTFNIKDGNYVAYGTPTNSKNFVTSEFVSTKNDTIRSLSLYTVNAAQLISNYSIRLDSLAFPTDLSSLPRPNRTFTTATTGAMNYSFTKAFTPELGKRYKIIIDFLTPSRRVNNVSGDVHWAYHNLFYNESTKVYGFRHYNSNFYEKGISVSSAKSGEYFNWRAAKPGFSEASGVLDPCGQVYPRGRWRLPTQAEFNTIVSIPSDVTSTIRKSNAQSTDPARYIDIRLGTGKFSPYDAFTNGLPMIMQGLRNVGSDAMTNYNTGVGGTAGLYYWTSNQTSTTNANYFFITNTVGSGATMTVNNSSNIAKNTGLNIRCVRNTTFTYTPYLN